MTGPSRSPYASASGTNTLPRNPTGLLRSQTILARAALLFVACCAGWYVMELEILGGRILNIYFGSSIYVVWGSVIGVFLLSLSLGYILGGWLSQGKRPGISLAVNLGLTALWIFMVVYVREPVCEGVFTRIPDERWGALTASLALFTVPTLLLGTVAPIVVRHLTREAVRSGISTGLVFCLSTVASFAGCVITAFYLISYDLTRVLQISAGFLFLLSLLLLWSELPRPRPTSRGVEI